MSKNFELLQRIGNCDKLFDSAGALADPSSLDAERKREVDAEERDRILEHASLPTVLTSDEDSRSLSASFVDRRGQNGNGNHEFPPRREVHEPESHSAPTFRSSKNAFQANDALPGEYDPERFAGVGGGTRQTLDFLENAGVLSASASLPDVIPQSPFDVEDKGSCQAAAGNAVGSQWNDSTRTAAKEWRRESRPRGSAYRADTETIAHEEEIKLVQRVFPEDVQDAPRVAVFSCVDQEAGCAAICARTAEILAARGEGPVCVVDADFLSPSLHRYFGVGNGRGLIEATLEPGPIHAFVQQIPEPDLWLLPSGRAPAELSFQAIAEGLRVRTSELKEAFRYVVIYGGRLRLEASAMLISRWTDGVVLILEANSTPRAAAKRTKQMLRSAKVNLLGVVLHNRTFPIPEAIYRRL